MHEELSKNLSTTHKELAKYLSCEGDVSVGVNANPVASEGSLLNWKEEWILIRQWYLLKVRQYFKNTVELLEIRRLLINLSIFSLSGGLIFALIRLPLQVIAPIVMLVIGACCIGGLLYIAFKVNNLWAKIGVYTSSLILSYELWILVARILM